MQHTERLEQGMTHLGGRRGANVGDRLAKTSANGEVETSAVGEGKFLRWPPTFSLLRRPAELSLLLPRIQL